MNDEALRLARCLANSDPSIYITTLSRALLAEHEAHEKTRADAARWKDLAERTVATNEGLCGDVIHSIESARDASARYDRVETILGVCGTCASGIVDNKPCERCYGTGIEVAAECVRLKRENDALRAAVREYVASRANSQWSAMLFRTGTTDADVVRAWNNNEKREKAAWAAIVSIAAEEP